MTNTIYTEPRYYFTTNFISVPILAEVSAEDVIGFVAGKVATFKQVREVEFIEAVPKNPSGKIMRRTLIELERERTS